MPCSNTISSFLALKTIPEIMEKFGKISQTVGASHYAFYGEVENLPQSYSTYPKEWLDYYFQNNFLERDPLHQDLKTANQPIYWEMTQPKFHFMRRCEDFEIKCGISIPIKNSQSKYLVTYTFKDYPQLLLSSPFSSQYLETWSSLLAHKMGDRILLSQSSLSRREIECLRWTAEGKTAEETAIILGITCWTVQFHLKNIYQKLNVCNKNAAVTKGLRLGII